MELIGVGDDVTAFVAENAHAFRPRSALDFEDHFLFQLHQAGMRQIEWNGDARGVFRAEPFAGNPGMWPHANIVLVKLAIKRVKAALEPGSLDRDPEILEPDLQQLVVGQRRPGIFPTRHGAKRPLRVTDRSCHGAPKATTGNPDSGAVLNINDSDRPVSRESDRSRARSG